MNIAAALNRLNSHRVFGIGLGTALSSVAILAADHSVSQQIAHVAASHGAVGPIAADVAGAWWSTAVASAQAALPPAIIAAAFGRPPNVPAGPVKP
ncbi:MAG: hypothetical protein JWM87_754 [Candidatus Eremiobacteraeota bacterium]|nr:hypothetical protein [Candidatus Eremiobacteraeota bacterium]